TVGASRVLPSGGGHRCGGGSRRLFTCGDGLLELIDLSENAGGLVIGGRKPLSVLEQRPDGVYASLGKLRLPARPVDLRGDRGALGLGCRGELGLQVLETALGARQRRVSLGGLRFEIAKQ